MSAPETPRRYDVPNSGKSFAVGDIVTLGPGGQSAIVHRVHVLGGKCEQVDLDMVDPTERLHIEGSVFRYGVSPKFLILQRKARP